MLGLESLGLRRPLDEVAGRFEDRAGGRPEFEAVIAEHNKNALGRGRKRDEIKLQGGWASGATLALSREDGPARFRRVTGSRTNH